MDIFKIVNVRHLTKTSDCKAKNFNTWIDFWEAKTKKEFPKDKEICLCCKMERNVFVGAHVYNVKNNKIYICPTCIQCNSKYGEGKEDSPTFRVLKSMLAEVTDDDTEIQSQQ